MSTPTAPPEEPVAGRPDEHRPSTVQRLLAGSSTQIGLILVGLIVIFSVLEFESFFAVANARNIATDAAVLLVLAVGATYVIITAASVAMLRALLTAKNSSNASSEKITIRPTRISPI